MSVDVARVRDLSARLLAAIENEIADVAIMGLLDSAVRVLQHHKALTTPDACKELARIVRRVGEAEAANHPKCARCGAFLSSVRVELRLTHCGRCK